MSSFNNTNHINNSPYDLTHDEIKRLRQLLDLINRPHVRKDKVMSLNNAEKHNRMKLLSRIVCHSHMIHEKDFFSYNRRQLFVRARADFAKIAYNYIHATKTNIGIFLGRTKLGSHSSAINLLSLPESHLYEDIEIIYKETPKTTMVEIDANIG